MLYKLHRILYIASTSCAILYCELCAKNMQNRNIFIINLVLALVINYEKFVLLQAADVGLIDMIRRSCNDSSKSSCRATNNNDHNNIPYPFAISSISSHECGLSPNFIIQFNCSQKTSIPEYLMWDSFTQALPDQDVQQGLISPPAILGLSYYNLSVSHVNLTWDSHYLQHPAPDFMHACRPPHSSNNLSHYFPTSFNLSRLLPGQLEKPPILSTFAISKNTAFLLLNCSTRELDTAIDSKPDSSWLQVVNGSSLCEKYTRTCNHNLTEFNCHTLDWFQDEHALSELALQKTMDKMSCTHFEVFVVGSGGPPEYHVAEVAQWLPGVMQLQWTDWGCLYCSQDWEECSYAANGSYERCTYNINVNSLYFWFDIIILGISLGGLLFLVALCCCAYRCGKRSMKDRRSRMSTLQERQHSGRSNADSMLSELVALNGLSERPVEYAYKSIESATSSFGSILGRGGFGVVFKGDLTESRDHKSSIPMEIAVKVLDTRSRHSRKQFMTEVAIIGMVHHLNVVRLLGYCVQDEHEMLVYEYVANGSLDKWLFDSNNEKQGMTLDWKQRYGIAIGIARGLSYLHEECRHRIVHCDIKPHNILLDGQMCPKISDFGLSRLINRDASRVVTLAKGTPGYMAPEFWVGGDIQLTTKADVYSFGMVLLELICGRRNFALGMPHFPAIAHNKAMEGDFYSLLDPRLTRLYSEQEGNNYGQQQVEQIRTAALVALWCIQDNPRSRPCMSEVVHCLEGVTSISEQPPQPAISSASLLFSHSNHIISTALPTSTTDLTPR